MAAQFVEVKTEEQLNHCIEIRMEVFVQEQNVPQEEECDEYDSLDAPVIHVLMMSDGQNVGTGRIKRLDDATAKMQRIAVRKQYRGLGMGRAMMLGLEQIARTHGLQKSVLDGQCQAEGFYHSLGYKTVSDTPFYDAGILHVRMEKEL